MVASLACVGQRHLAFIVQLYRNYNRSQCLATVTHAAWEGGDFDVVTKRKRLGQKDSCITVIAKLSISLKCPQLLCGETLNVVDFTRLLLSVAVVSLMYPLLFTAGLMQSDSDNLPYLGEQLVRCVSGMSCIGPRSNENRNIQ